MFEKHDRVYDIRFGWGTVTDVMPDDAWPLRVTMDNFKGRKSYLSDGRAHSNHLIPMLFHGNPNICPPPEPVRLPDLKTDAPIFVRNYEGEPWKHRHFKEWTEDGKAKTFSDGKTSFTTRLTLPWEHWKLPE